MAEPQKKMQELSDDYQNLQSGKIPSVAKGILADARCRTVDHGRSPPDARIATAREHYSEEGGRRIRRLEALS
jgi:hypothetical protein